MEEKKKKSAIYVRVSTLYQADKDSLPMQKKDLIAYSQLVLGIDDYEIFEDAGYSGKNTDRPGFQSMMQRVRNHEFTHVLVWKIDRISRNLLDFAQMYDELRRLRVVFVSKNEQFDTSTAMGEAMLKIILVFAELERNMTSERVTATMISRANSGIWNGGRIPFGYDYNKVSESFSINESEAIVVRLIRDDYIKNKSMLHTTRLLNDKGYVTKTGGAWTPTGVCKIIESPFYCGIYRYNRYKGTEKRTTNPESEWVTVENHHPAIISIDDYNKLCAIREENRRLMNNVGQAHYGAVHIFGGLIYCGKCGSRMVSTPGKVRKKDGFHPSVYSCPLKRVSKRCDNPSMNDTVVGEFVINYVLNMLNAKKSFSSISSPEDLEKRLLRGHVFTPVKYIGNDGLNEYYNLLSRYRSDNSFTLAFKNPKRKATVNPETESLRKEKDKQERALSRLQQAYLYSDNAMPEKDYIIARQEITEKISEINKKLGMVSASASDSLSDEEFVRQASHLLISSWLKDKQYIHFPDLALNVSVDVLHTYMAAIIDSITIKDSHVISITFKNGLTHKFIY